MFRHVTTSEGVQVQVESMAITKGSWAMEINTGRIGMSSPKMKTVFFDPRELKDKNWDMENWDHIHIVNFKKLKKNIDKAFSGL